MSCNYIKGTKCTWKGRDELCSVHSKSYITGHCSVFGCHVRHSGERADEFLDKMERKDFIWSIGDFSTWICGRKTCQYNATVRFVNTSSGQKYSYIACSVESSHKVRQKLSEEDWEKSLKWCIANEPHRIRSVSRGYRPLYANLYPSAD